MTLRQRLGIAALLAMPALVAYAAARYYSPELIGLVVERALIEKSPPGTDPATVKDRLGTILAAADRRAKLEILLQLSQYLEKSQELTRPELERSLQQAGRDLPLRK